MIEKDARLKAAEYMRSALTQFARNGRWGTCGACPRDTAHNVYPEFCQHTERYDHQLDMPSLASQYEFNLQRYRDT